MNVPIFINFMKRLVKDAKQISIFYSRPEGQFNSFSHAFDCTEDATLAIGPTQCDDDPS
ncbi:hypothetical protein MPC4_320008 [Methylocella tundrae]|uniref:Uncharacterized protein n=1 Tax=Methylocella tundrae TaxID=227605 RepID=A0A8B6M8H2_METTU|nr:hypothetical protein MPC1_1500002 [Methylocella tundrae]VTZ51176.1 hypothetical protein MPC4_320008 [Methylocella tundrae]